MNEATGLESKFIVQTNHESEQAQLKPVQQLINVISSVWNNPLVDKNLERFREESKQVLTEKMNALKGQYPDLEWAALPCGSAIGGIAQEEKDDLGQHHISDRDFILFTNNYELNEQIQDNHSFLGKGIDIVTVSHWDNLPLNEDMPKVGNNWMSIGLGNSSSNPTYINTLFTPDELVCGDLAMVRAIRIGSINHLARSFDNPTYRKVFEDYYMTFANIKSKNPIIDTERGLAWLSKEHLDYANNKNHKRFINTLLERTSQFDSTKNIEGIATYLLIRLGILPQGNTTIQKLSEDLPDVSALRDSLRDVKGYLPRNTEAQNLRYNPVHNGFLRNLPSTYKK